MDAIAPHRPPTGPGRTDDGAFVPAVPFRPVFRPGNPHRPQVLWNYFRVMSRNPLEVWSDRHFEQEMFAAEFLGQKYLIAHAPEAVRHVYVTHPERYRFSYLRQAVLTPFLREGLLVAEGKTWETARRALNPVFTPRHVAGFGMAMNRVVGDWLAGLEARDGETIDFGEEMLQLALDILLACLFSDDDRLDARRFSRDLNRLGEVSGLPHPFDLVRAPDWVPRLGREEGARRAESLRGQVGRIAQARRRAMARGEAVPEDFVTLLLRAGVDDGTPLSDDAIIDNLLTFLAAGHETTARTLTWCFYLLSQVPEAAARVREEIASAGLDAADPAAWPRQLPFTMAVIKETMRLYPAAAQLSRTAIEGDDICGRPVTAGTEVITSTWVLHRHRKLWDDPEAFRPERFFGAAGDAIPRHAWLPFGIGARVCIGASFSMQEMAIVLARLVPAFDLAYAGTASPIPVMRITLQPSVPVTMRLTRHGTIVN